MAIAKLSFGLGVGYDPPFSVDDTDVDRIKLRSKESAPLTHNTLDENFANLALKVNALIDTGIDTITISDSKVAAESLALNNGTGISYSSSTGVFSHQDKPNNASGYTASADVDVSSTGLITGLNVDSLGHLAGYKSSTTFYGDVSSTNVTGTTVKQGANKVLDVGNLSYTKDGNYYPLEKDENDALFVHIPWTDTTYSTATASAQGLVKIGYTTDGDERNYAVQLSADNKMYVNVPWTDNNDNTNQLTTFNMVDGDGGSVTIAHDNHVKFVEGGGIDIDWTDNTPGSSTDPYDLTFTLNPATATALGGVKVSFADGVLTIST